MQKMNQSLSPDEAYRKLTRRCAVAECSPADMERKMRVWNLSESDIANLMKRLYDKGFINDERFAYAFVRDKFEYAGWGKVKISHALKLKGIAQPLIAQALNEINPDAYEQQLTHLLKRKNETIKATSDYDRRIKLARFAAGRGFEQSVVFELLDQIVFASD